MNLRPLTAALLLIFLASCRQSPPVERATAEPAAAKPATAIMAATTVPTVVEATPSPAAPTPTAASLAMPTRIGAEHVLRLPRESAVPANWIINPAPAFERRDPQPRQTYRYACLNLPARSIGVASVGYRHLEGMPNVYIEYVIYQTAEDAAAALADMRQATEACASFTIGEGESAIEATVVPLDFPAYGDDSFALALETSAPTADLVTHAVKVLTGRIIIGVNHAAYADDLPPDAALTESLVEVALENLANDFH
jgi:hypothetical protein